MVHVAVDLNRAAKGASDRTMAGRIDDRSRRDTTYSLSSSEAL